MNLSSLRSSSESTQKYQRVFSGNTTYIKAYSGGTISQVIQQHQDCFELAAVVPYDFSELSEQNLIKESYFLYGSGSFGTVYKNFYILKSIPCALKVHQNCTEKEILEIVNEYTIQCKLNEKFPNNFVKIIKPVYIIINEQKSFSSFAGMGECLTTLDKYIKETTIVFQEFQSIYHSILSQILKMHSLHIAHRDIKPQNIMYSTEFGWMIGDFGCSMIYQKTKGKYQIAGTKAYLPKYIKNQISHIFDDLEMEMDLFDNDIYAFLVTMLQIYKKDFNIQKIQNIIENKNDPSMKDDGFKYLFQIYEKSYSFIKQHILISFPKIPIDNLFLIQQQQMALQFNNNLRVGDYNLETMIKLFYLDDRNRKQILQFKEEKTMFDIIQKKIQLTNQEIEVYKKLFKYLPILSNNLLSLKEFKDQKVIEIGESTQKWQYEVLQYYYFRLSNIKLQIETCQSYQKYSDKHFVELKIFEIDRLLFIGNDQLAVERIKNLENDQYFLDEISTLKLKTYQAILNDTWLLQAPYFYQSINLSHHFFTNTLFLHLKLALLFWVCDYQKYPIIYTEESQENRSEHFMVQICESFGVQVISTSAIIFNLLNRGADFCGVAYVLLQLIQAFVQIPNELILSDLFVETVQFFKSHNEVKHLAWYVLLIISLYYYQINNFQLSLQYSEQAYTINQKNNKEINIIILIEIYYSNLKLQQYKKAQEFFQQICFLIRSLPGGFFRTAILKKIIKGLYILFQQENIIDLNQQSEALKQSLNQIDNSELTLLCKLEWEILLTFQKSNLLKLNLDSEMIKICLSNTQNDIDLLKCLQNIKVIARKESMQSKETLITQINMSARLMQNLIIYQDLLPFTQTETLNIANEIVRATHLLGLEKQQTLNMMSKYQYQI